MSSLPIHLQRLESLPSALDILRLMNQRPDARYSVDDICDGLNISERRYSKANRRLVTLGYVQMTNDGYYELTRKGRESGAELVAYDASAPIAPSRTQNKLRRRLVLALPQHLVAGQTATARLGIPADDALRFSTPTDVVLRIDGQHVQINDGDLMLKMANESLLQSLELTPEAYDKVRVRVQAYQLSPWGDDLSVAGGMYIDIPVQGSGVPGDYVAYGVDLFFDPV